MNVDISPLFTPLKVKNKELRNRIVMPPMRTNREIHTREGIEWYGRRAKGGVGLVIVEATPVDRFGPDLNLKNMKALADIIHEGGALAAIQLIPVGYHRHSLSPAEIGEREIEEILKNYQIAGEICAAAGFDGLEPHGAHGYLLNQFFSPVQNRRKDEFGGAFGNRVRLALNIVKVLRSICGGGMLLFYRHTPVGQGYDVEESTLFAGALIQAGVDVLDLSPSSIDFPGDKALPFKKLGVPVISVNGLNHVPSALEVLNHQRADLVAVGRGLIADPEWPVKVKEGRFQDIVECTGCRKKCYGNLAENLPIECVEWG
jgi:NADPH2 dehydrogenase